MSRGDTCLLSAAYPWASCLAVLAVLCTNVAEFVVGQHHQAQGMYEIAANTARECSYADEFQVSLHSHLHLHSPSLPLPLHLYLNTPLRLITLLHKFALVYCDTRPNAEETGLLCLLHANDCPDRPSRLMS